MLIEFSASNFLSLREKQTFSMVASQRDDSLPGNLIPLSLPGLPDLSLVKTAVLYGANASGKSNLLKSLRFIDWFVENSAAKLAPDQPTSVVPFRLSAETARQPSEFEITFIAEGVRYQFGFVVDSERVYSEWLYAYPDGRPQRWYQRDYDSKTGQYSWNFSQKHFRGAKGTLTQQTRPNALFLSTAAQFNHEQLLAVYRWFPQKLINLDLAQSELSIDIAETAFVMTKAQALRSKICGLLSRADLGIASVEIEEVEFNPAMLPKEWSSEAKEELLRVAKGSKIPRLHWLHNISDSDSTVSFETSAESAGTLRFFSALGPLLTAVEFENVLAVDELGASIHPLLVRSLLSSFQRTEEPERKAQAIVTTHDTTLLDRATLRRDQIWFTEKTKDGATRLYPLTDFHPRKDESLERGYLAGRYGAIPFLTGDLPL